MTNTNLCLRHTSDFKSFIMDKYIFDNKYLFKKGEKLSKRAVSVNLLVTFLATRRYQLRDND